MPLMKDFLIILFYKFADIAEPKKFAELHREKCKELGLLGRMLVAEEGVNATFEGTRENIELYKDFLKSSPLFADVLIKESTGTGSSFPKLAIKVRKEIVTLGAGRFNVKEETATELKAEDLQKWYESGEDFTVLDLRNDYGIATGKFDKTIDPGLSNFRDLPNNISKIADLKNKKVVAVCTGGIRCEKATCLLKKEGFSNIYQLKDGIHTYIKEFPGKHFKGKLFVFDNRMVTDVVSEQDKEILGKCDYCAMPTERYYSDDNFRPSKKVLACDPCYLREAVNLRECRN